MDGIVLVVDHDRTSRAGLVAFLRRAGWQVLEVDSGLAAMAILGQVIPDLVVVRADLAGHVRSVELCRRLKRSEDTHRVSVLFLDVAEPDPFDAFEAGADDCMAMPGEDRGLRGLLARATGLIARKRELDRLYERATRDELTGLWNRAAFCERLACGIGAVGGRPLAGILGDIDHFKGINDTYGHAAGDRVLAQVAAVLGRQIRAVDMVARWGGEEFALAVMGSLMTAVGVANRLRAAVDGGRCQIDSGPLCVTMSFGVAVAVPADTPESLIARADKALYHAKGNGRNVVCYEHDGLLATWPA